MLKENLISWLIVCLVYSVSCLVGILFLSSNISKWIFDELPEEFHVNQNQ